MKMEMRLFCCVRFILGLLVKLEHYLVRFEVVDIMKACRKIMDVLVCDPFYYARGKFQHRFRIVRMSSRCVSQSYWSWLLIASMFIAKLCIYRFSTLEIWFDPPVPTSSPLHQILYLLVSIYIHEAYLLI